MSNLKLRVLVVAISTFGLGISGCDGSGGNRQDMGTISSVNVSGMALDGYLANSLVFQDVNKNGVRDAFEAFAYTDSMGYYGFNPDTDVDYCTAADTSLRTHCLSAVAGDYPIVVSGGYDLVSGEPFHGQLQKRISVTQDRSPLTLDFITPVSTMLSYTNSVEEENTVLARLALARADLDRDFYNRSADSINQVENSAADWRLIAVTQKLHRMASAAAKITETTFKVKDEIKLPTYTTPYIYEALTETVLDSDDDISAVLADTAKINGIMTSVRGKITAAYTTNNIPLPDLQATPATVLSSDDISNLSQLPAVIENLVDQLPKGSSPTVSGTKATAKAIDLVSEKIAKRRSPADITATVAAFNDPTSRAALMIEFAKDSTNSATLINVDFSDIAAVQDVTDINFGAVFAGLSTKHLAFGESDLNADKDLSAILFFNATNQNATSGTMVACIRYVNGLKSNNTLKAGGTIGTYSSTGSWTVINGGFGMIINLKLAGAQKSATIQYGGPNDNQQYIYRTDFGDELTSWVGPSIPDDFNGTVPTNDATCKTALDTIDPMDTALATKIVTN